METLNDENKLQFDEVTKETEKIGKSSKTLKMYLSKILRLFAINWRL